VTTVGESGGVAGRGESAGWLLVRLEGRCSVWGWRARYGPGTVVEEGSWRLLGLPTYS
jgi:hypothetical protein